MAGSQVLLLPLPVSESGLEDEGVFRPTLPSAIDAPAPASGTQPTTRAVLPPVALVPPSRGAIAGRDERVREVLDVIARVAPSSCTVLVTGERGTGKDLVVAALHRASKRRTAPFVTVSCGATPEDLIESELFGHGVAAAEGGTLFLDEVGELSPAMQTKVLRLLQRREYQPLGESRIVKCDVRVVAATNRDLETEIAAGRFREDLYYRLSVIHVHMPALRERRDDVKVLASRFLDAAAAHAGRDDLLGFSDAALACMAGYGWPGNVRELENTVERLVLLARGPFVEEGDLAPKLRRPATFGG